jgi:hypothetical protein
MGLEGKIAAAKGEWRTIGRIGTKMRGTYVVHDCSLELAMDYKQDFWLLLGLLGLRMKLSTAIPLLQIQLARKYDRSTGHQQLTKLLLIFPNHAIKMSCSQ